MLGFVATFFNLALYRPLFNFLVFIYNVLPGHDFGVAIILLTLIIRVVILPLSIQAVKSQRAMQKLQPKIQEIQQKYKEDKEKQARETLALYKTEKINPFSGLFLALIQLPILIALYRVFWNGLKTSELSNLYGFVANPGHLNSSFFGLIDLSKASIYFAIAAGIMQFVQTKMLMPKTEKKPGQEPDFSEIMQKQMLYFFPFMTILILMGLPSALGLYWIASGVFTIIQQYILIKKSN